jgi:hypothetical protein
MSGHTHAVPTQSAAVSYPYHLTHIDDAAIISF